MTLPRRIPAFAPPVLDYGEEAPDPPAHPHRGPWAVFQAFDPARHAVGDRARAARLLRHLVLDPASPRSELLALGRRALAVVLSARLLGQAPDELTLYVRIVRDRQGRLEDETARGGEEG